MKNIEIRGKDAIEKLRNYIHDLEKQIELRDELIRLYQSRKKATEFPNDFMPYHYHGYQICFMNPCVWC